jgi:hypothetical protein
MDTRKIGTIYSTNPRGWAFIAITPQERYFAHISELKLDHWPVVGEQVSFSVKPPRCPLRESELPLAVDVRAVGTPDGRAQEIADVFDAAKNNEGAL